MSESKKRKVDLECRNFNEAWTVKYLFTNINKKAVCLVCQETIAVFKEYNLNRHFTTKHPKYASHSLKELQTVAENLAKNLNKQQNIFTKQSNIEKSTTKASYVVAHKIAKLCKPFSEAEFVKQCMVQVSKICCPEKKHIFENVSLSRRTIVRRIENISGNLLDQLRTKIADFTYCSLALDESCDITDTSQLLIFIRGINKKCEINEELLSVHPMKDTTTGEDFFLAVEECLVKRLLTTSLILFSPTSLIVNNSNTLAAAICPTGVLVIELPSIRSPPYGQFDDNKELIYCRSHTILESLAFNGNVEIRQVKFHVASAQDTHILVLTSNNVLRLYNVLEGNVISIGIYAVGIQPKGCFPTTKMSFLEALGDTAVDFDFGPPESKDNETDFEGVGTSVDQFNKMDEYNWPVYVLYKNGDVYTVFLELNRKLPAVVKGPLELFPKNQENYGENSCSILCLLTTPTILCISNTNGTIHHALVLSCDENDEDYALEMSKEERPRFIEDPDRSLYVFECISLQLGFSSTKEDINYTCPVNLYPNQGKCGHYFATHETGVHSINVRCVESLHKFVDSKIESEEDVFSENSTAEYLLSTTINNSDLNPVIGFSLYYDMNCVLILLANGQFVSLTVSSLFTPAMDTLVENFENLNFPMEKVLSEPFDVKIQKILELSSTQPILKTNEKANYTQQECFDLLQNASQKIHERIKNHMIVKEEIEKHTRILSLLEDVQKNDFLKLKQNQQLVRNNAEALAEKYEDIKDKQDGLTKRFEQLLMQISRKMSVPSNAETDYLNEMSESGKKVKMYAKAIQKLKEKIKYQELQMENWHKRKLNQHKDFKNVQIDAIKSNLQEMNEKITIMISQINQFKKQINIK